VRSLWFHPRGLSPEAHTIANALGSCVVDAPHLQSELVTLLRPQTQQQIADRSSSVEALVPGVALALCHSGKEEIYVKEIAAEINRLLVARGETMQMSPEKVGHKLKKIGLFSRRLSQAVNGLTLGSGDPESCPRSCQSLPGGGFHIRYRKPPLAAVLTK
jgi:hypothetical protein